MYFMLIIFRLVFKFCVSLRTLLRSLTVSGSQIYTALVSTTNDPHGSRHGAVVVLFQGSDSNCAVCVGPLSSIHVPRTFKHVNVLN